MSGIDIKSAIIGGALVWFVMYRQMYLQAQDDTARYIARWQ